MGRVSESVGTLLSVGKDLEQSLNNLAADRAIVAANERVQQIRQETGKDAEAAMQQMTQLSQDLSMRLGQLNQPASKIGAITGQLAPSVGAQFQAQENQAAQERSQAFQAGQNALNRQAQLKAADIRQTRQDEKFQKSELSKARFKFTSDTKDIRKAIDQSKTAISLLDSNNPVINKSIQTFLARATGEVGNLTEAERSVFAGRPGIMAELKRMRQQALGQPLNKEDADLLKSLASDMGAAATSALEERAQSAISSTVSLTGIDEEKAISIIAPEVKTILTPSTDVEAAKRIDTLFSSPEDEVVRNEILNIQKKIRETGREGLSENQKLFLNKIEQKYNLKINNNGGMVVR